MASLSTLATENNKGPDLWAGVARALDNVWSPDNDGGMVSLGLAENQLMQKEMAQHLEQAFKVNQITDFSYGNGPQGSRRLCAALSSYVNDYFKPLQPTNPQQFLVTAGVTGLIDQLTWATCDPGDGILVPQPFFNGFGNDMRARSRGKLVPVSFEREDGSLVFDDVFDAEANARCLERALRKSHEDGVKIKAVMITNPHNPMGKCYSPSAIRAIAKFCAAHDLHYLSDEIYAMSTFDNPASPSAIPFSSVLSIDLSNVISPEQVHVLYGVAKDFGANGLRLGVLFTRSVPMLNAIRSVSVFAWPAYLTQDCWARILEDKEFVQSYQAENRRRLAKHHGIFTSFLDAHGISYLRGSNAGLFVWVDVRAQLLGKGFSNADLAAEVQTAPTGSPSRFSELKVSSSPEWAALKAKQDKLIQLWRAKGVAMLDGQGCGAGELGWFRISFVTEERVLRKGLERIWEGLLEAKLTGIL